MAIAKIGTDTSNITATTASYNWSHTLVAGSNRIIVVSVGGETNGIVSAAWNVTSMTYGGQVMTKAVSTKTTEPSNGASSEIWYIKEADLPSDGANTVQVNGQDGGTAVFLFGLCAEYSGMDQGSLDVTNGVFENSTVVDDTIENSISPSNDAWVISTYACGNLGTDWTVGQSQVELVDVAGGTTARMGTCELRGASGETSLSSTFNTTANRMTRVAVSFNILAVTTQTHQMML